MSNYLLEMKNIEKTFGTNNVLSKVSFQLKKEKYMLCLEKMEQVNPSIMDILGCP